MEPKGFLAPLEPPRRKFLRTTLLAGATTAALPALAAARELAPDPSPSPAVSSFELDEANISDLQDGMTSGRHSAHSITQKYLARIDEIDKHGPMVNSVIEVNPDALAIADALDKERKEKGASRAHAWHSCSDQRQPRYR